MKKLILVPEGWPVPFSECPPGLFLKDDMVGLKTEYGKCEGYCDSGETFLGGASTQEDLAKVIVQPLTYAWNLE